MKRLFILCLALMLGSCGGAASQGSGTTSTDVLSVSSFKGVVSGAVSGDFSGAGSYFKQNGGGLLIGLVATQVPASISINIVLPDGTVAGTYPLKSYTDAYDSTTNKITAIGASFSARNKTNGTDIYTTISEGTLTLDSVDPMTGSIHFKAKLDNGREVDVSATFYQLITA